MLVVELVADIASGLVLLLEDLVDTFQLSRRKKAIFGNSFNTELATFVDASYVEAPALEASFVGAP